jgi:ketosteroid isomerase-like protein
MFATTIDSAGRAAVLLLALAPFAAPAAAAGAPKLHASRDQREELLDADRDFDAATSRDGAQGWASFFADDGVMMPAGADIVVGRENVRDYVEKNVFGPGIVLRWEPIEAYVAGGLGYTYGVYKLTKVEAPGKNSSLYGKYMTVWKKVKGRWLVAVDIGNNSPEPKR